MPSTAACRVKKDSRAMLWLLDFAHGGKRSAGDPNRHNPARPALFRAASSTLAGKPFISRQKICSRLRLLKSRGAEAV
jgi:hypothetical protein